MGIAKALGHLGQHIMAHGLLRGPRLVWLKSHRSPRPARVSSPLTGGEVQVRPGTADMAIYDQIVLQPYLPRDRNYVTIIDCGANIGLTARYWKAACSDATVVAVEPDKANFDLLVTTTAGLANVHCVQAGIWPSSGKLQLEREKLGSSGFRTHATGGPGEIDAVTMPELMARFGIERLSLLKVDIEGAEKELFSGPDLQWIDRVEAIAIELHDQWKPGCGDAFFKAIARHSWTYSIHGEMILCERRP